MQIKLGNSGVWQSSPENYVHKISSRSDPIAVDVQRRESKIISSEWFFFSAPNFGISIHVPSQAGQLLFVQKISALANFNPKLMDINFCSDSKIFKLEYYFYNILLKAVFFGESYILPFAHVGFDSATLKFQASFRLKSDCSRTFNVVVTGDCS